MKKRLVSILLVLVMVLGMLPTVAFAADTAATRISTEAEFVAMEAGGNYILDTDITITKPHSGDFQGHFDGNGHTITLSGMTSSPFGIVNGPSTIENLKVAGSVTGTSYLAGIAGMANTADGEIKIIEDEAGKLIWECPNCGNRDQNKLFVARRTCGYIGTQFWNQGRTQEIRDRVLHL